MQAVIPAAGEGTRLRPLTLDRPKALVEVAGTPLLARCFEQLQFPPIEEFVVIVGHRGDQIVDRFGDSFDGVPITYAWQHDQRGLAHALLRAEDRVDGDFLLANGDNVFRTDLSRVVARHLDEGVDAVALVEDVSLAEARTTGVVETADGRITGMVEKPDDPPSTLVSAGAYAFSPAVFDACRRVEPGAEGEHQLSDAVALLCHAGKRVVPVRVDGWRLNVNTPADVERAERRLREEGGRSMSNSPER